jgi:hypothetical protein
MDNLHQQEEDDLYADLDATIPPLQQRKRLKMNEDSNTSPSSTGLSNPPGEPHVHGLIQMHDSYPYNSFETNDSLNKSDLFTSMQQDIERLEKRVVEYQTENEILKRNMGTLYRTAKLELDRKNRRIEELEKMLDQTNQFG